MDIASMADVKLTGRALTHGWLDSCPEKRQAAVDSLIDIVTTSKNESMRVKAFEALVKADAADLKREEVILKKQAMDEHRRLKLLEFLRSLPPGEMARIAAEHQAAAGIG